jgi:hypothetical protein
MCLDRQGLGTLLRKTLSLKRLTWIRCLPQWGFPPQPERTALWKTRCLRRFFPLKSIESFHPDEVFWAPYRMLPAGLQILGRSRPEFESWREGLSIRQCRKVYNDMLIRRSFNAKELSILRYLLTFHLVLARRLHLAGDLHEFVHDSETALGLKGGSDQQRTKGGVTPVRPTRASRSAASCCWNRGRVTNPAETPRVRYFLKKMPVVEDAQPLRDLICEALSKFGCTVLSAHNAPGSLADSLRNNNCD